MKLSDVRKMAIRQQVRVHFSLSNGGECIVYENGIARMPGIADIPTLNLEDEFALASQVRLEPVTVASKTQPRIVLRAELEKLTSNSPQAAADDDHDE